MGNQLKDMAMIACLKTFLFAFNVIFWICGLFLLTVGLWAEFDLYHYLEMSPEFSGTAPHVILGIATLNVLVSSIAFACIVKGQAVLLYIYGGILACMFMMNTGVVLSVTCYRDTFAPGLHAGLTNTLTNAHNSQMANFDFAQSTLHCCGVSNYTDWMRLSPQRVIPPSCCIDPYRCITANYNDVYQRGCFEVMLEYLKTNLGILIAIAIATASLPLAGAFLAFNLATYLKLCKYDTMN